MKKGCNWSYGRKNNFNPMQSRMLCIANLKGKRVEEFHGWHKD